MSAVLLINPDVGFCWDRYTVKPNLPYAILCVGTALHRAGYEVRLLDQRVDKAWKSNLLEELEEEIICVGISSMTGNQIMNGLEIARVVRAHSHRPIVWGGIHPTLLPEQTLENEFVDIVVRGEGEETIVQLVNALQDNKPLNDIRGVSYKENGKVYHNPDRAFIDLDKQPPLCYELLDIHDYISEQHGYRSINFNTSRGCPYNCAFCYANAYHKRRWRALSVQNVVKRMTTLRDRYGINRFWFEDDNFFTDLDRARELMNEFKKLNIRWVTRGATIDTILRMDDGFLDLVEQSGCTRLAMGAESGSNRMLALMKKRVKREDTIEANRKLAKYNVYPRFNFMMGLPTETAEDLRETVSLALQIRRENEKAILAPFNIFTPYPGCELHDLAIQHGLKRPTCLEEWAKFRLNVDNTAWLSNNVRTSIKVLAFASPFLNDPIDTNPTFFVKLLSTAYRPIARQRIKHFFFSFPIEVSLARLLRLYDGR